MMDTINDRTLLKRGRTSTLMTRKGRKLADMLLIIEYQHTILCLLSSKTNRMALKWFEAHLQ